MHLKYKITNNQNPQKPTVVFLHNGNCSSEIWERQLSDIKDFNILTLDFPGQGQNRPFSGSRELSSYTQYLRDILIKEKLENVILIGNCIGSSVALNYSQLYNDDVQSLILFNICPGRYLLPIPIFRDLWFKLVSFKFIQDNFFSFFQLFSFGRIEEIIPLNKLFNRKESKKSSLYAKLLSLFREKEMKANRYKLFLQLDSYTLKNYFKENQKNQVPITLVWGNENKIINSFTRKRVTKIIKPTSVYYLQGGHLMVYEESDVLNELISKKLLSYSN